MTNRSPAHIKLTKCWSDPNGSRVIDTTEITPPIVVCLKCYERLEHGTSFILKHYGRALVPMPLMSRDPENALLDLQYQQLFRETAYYPLHPLSILDVGCHIGFQVWVVTICPACLKRTLTDFGELVHGK